MQEIDERLRGTHQITRARQHQLRPEMEDGREKYYHVTAAVPEAPGHYWSQIMKVTASHGDDV